MQIILTEDEYNALVKKSLIRRALERKTYNLRAAGCHEERFKFIAAAFEDACRQCGIDFNMDWRP